MSIIVVTVLSVILSFQKSIYKLYIHNELYFNSLLKIIFENKLIPVERVYVCLHSSFVRKSTQDFQKQPEHVALPQVNK